MLLAYVTPVLCTDRTAWLCVGAQCVCLSIDLQRLCCSWCMVVVFGWLVAGASTCTHLRQPATLHCCTPLPSIGLSGSTDCLQPKTQSCCDGIPLVL